MQLAALINSASVFALVAYAGQRVEVAVEEEEEAAAAAAAAEKGWC